ncbi:hypothetical protein I8748_02925 [Nostoc sp. CENA67]|uniref:SPOR domain-containing protein n=1 Tax=Amazonocrinis nigriterrae CENA67 TaxID=2794033 RepID=A0A8J7HKA6_9NOST|nr:hypothetical protein [Amazonocrinis nigriterrae]MBH8561142.1 hypothetical protein [Amazonocrinis nigriterrae CENA67]
MSKIRGKFIRLEMVSLFLGGLAVLSPSIPAQAQMYNSNLLLAQQGVVDSLPPPPDIQTIPYGEQPLPQLQPSQSVQEFGPSQSVQEFVPSQSVQFNQYGQYGQNFQRYLVYVDNYNYQTLQQVRRIEPGAYIRSYQGRSVIQSGVFSRLSGAQERVRQLQSYGIYGAQIVSSGNAQQIPTYPNRGDRDVYRRQSSSYYVAIPAKSEELPAIAQRIRQSTGLYGFILQRQSPRGPHVAVGPFPRRTEAEEWNNRLHNLGFGDARVYYGK